MSESKKKKVSKKSTNPVVLKSLSVDEILEGRELAMARIKEVSKELRDKYPTMNETTSLEVAKEYYLLGSISWVMENR